MALTREQLNMKVQDWQQRGANPADIQRLVGDLERTGMVEKEPSMLMKVGKAVVDPLISAGRTVGALGGMGYAALQGVAGNEKGALETANYVTKNIMDERMRKAYMPQDKGSLEQSLSSMGEGLKLGAGLSSYMIPAGTTFKSAVGLGALGGALRGGYEPGNVEETLSNAVGSGIFGGVAGGAVYGAGKAISALKTAKPVAADPYKVVGTGLNTKDPSFVNNKKVMQNIADELQLTKSMTPDELAAKLPEGLKQYNDEILKYLREGKQLKYGDVFNAFDEQLKKTDYLEDRKVYGTLKKEMEKRLSAALNSTDDINTGAYNLKSELTGELSKTFNKPQLSPTEQVKKALYDGIKDALDNVSPQVRTLNMKQKAIYDLADEINNTLLKDAPARIELPFISPTGFKGQTGLGFDMPYTRGQSSAAFNKLGQNIKGYGQALMEPYKPGLGNQALQAIASRAPATFGNIPAEANPLNIQSLDTGMTGIGAGPSGITQGTLGTTTVTPEEMQKPLDPFRALELKAQGVDISKMFVVSYDGQNMWNPQTQQWMQFDYPTWLKRQGGANESSTLAGQKASSAEDAINQLETMYSEIKNQGQVGLIGGRLGAALGSVNLSPKAATYEAQRKSLAALIARAMGETGPLSNPDIERYTEALPKLTDDPKTAAEKVAKIRALIGSVKLNYTQ